jgi:hypothetical protein
MSSLIHRPSRWRPPARSAAPQAQVYASLGRIRAPDTVVGCSAGSCARLHSSGLLAGEGVPTGPPRAGNAERCRAPSAGWPAGLSPPVDQPARFESAERARRGARLQPGDQGRRGRPAVARIGAHPNGRAEDRSRLGRGLWRRALGWNQNGAAAAPSGIDPAARSDRQRRGAGECMN